jgi:uncharacterized protein (TIGR00730 family)
MTMWKESMSKKNVADDNGELQEANEPPTPYVELRVNGEAPADPARRPIQTRESMVEDLKKTADKLLDDDASRGDVKLIVTAVKELRYALKVFKQHADTPKVTVFGSARTPADHPSYQQAVAFGRQMARAGWMVVTGAASGIMEAGHVGAGAGNSLGVNILLPFEQKANAIMEEDRHRLVHFKYFFTRKLMFVKEAKAVALFPGGFGTQDENFEVLTLVQTGKSHLFPVVLVDSPGGHYWRRWLEFIRDDLLAQGYICESDLSLFKITSSVDEAVAEILNFYRVYHSMRYVGDTLVLRLKRPLTAAMLEHVQSNFADILAGGAFEQTPAALPAEANEEKLRDFPRLRFRFDRKSLGRLRVLIDFINERG